MSLWLTQSNNPTYRIFSLTYFQLEFQSAEFHKDPLPGTHWVESRDKVADRVVDK